MTKQKPDLANILADAGGSRRKNQPDADPQPEIYTQPGRAGAWATNTPSSSCSIRTRYFMLLLHRRTGIGGSLISR